MCIRDSSDTHSKDKTKQSIDSIRGELKSIWEHNDTTSFHPLMLHYTRIALFLGNERPPATPSAWKSPFSPIPDPVPERVKDPSDYYFTMESEVQNLQDLSLVHTGFMKILENLKKREGAFDFDDVQRLAGDLLLANCPDYCRSFYPVEMQKALDSISGNTWRDDHIHDTFSILERFERDPKMAGAASSDLASIRSDLEYRFELLKNIRRRYRAFIIDESQDNSQVQWRL